MEGVERINGSRSAALLDPAVDVAVVDWRGAEPSRRGEAAIEV